MFGTIQDVTERIRGEEDLKISNEKLRALAAHLQSVREEESIRMAREIHDELGSALTGLKMDISWADRHLPTEGNEPMHQKFREMSQFIDETIRKVRNISTELRPLILDDVGLAAAIEWQCREFQKRTEIKSKIISLSEDIALSQHKATAVFRIFQEILTNIARHSQATLVEVSMEEHNNDLVLKVSDNGIGIKESDISDTRSLGILGMRERAVVFGGRVEIIGAEGKGTMVTIRIPRE
jgi:signal transduction histidine kinase